MMSGSAAAEPREAWLQGAIEGDPKAFEQLVREYDADLQRVCFVAFGDRTTAQDAVQSAWEIAWRKIGQVRAPDKIRGWLIAVALNEGRRIRRRRGDLPIVDLGLAAPPSMNDPDLGDALSRLGVADRQLLALIFVAGLSSAEAAGILGMTPAGIRTRKARLMARIRKDLTK